MLTLYHGAPSRSSLVHWMLEEIGEPYQLNLLDLKNGENRQPPYLAINPMGKVPALRHDEVLITESAAICCYLADAFPKANLAFPIGDPRRGPYLKWLFFAPSCMEPAIIDKALNREGGSKAMLGWGDLETVVDVLVQAVAKGPYLFGDQFTAADVIVGGSMRWTLMFNLLPERPEFRAYVSRLEQRPALQRTVEKDKELAAA